MQIFFQIFLWHSAREINELEPYQLVVCFKWFSPLQMSCIKLAPWITLDGTKIYFVQIALKTIDPERVKNCFCVLHFTKNGVNGQKCKNDTKNGIHLSFTTTPKYKMKYILFSFTKQVWQHYINLDQIIQKALS